MAMTRYIQRTSPSKRMSLNKVVTVNCEMCGRLLEGKSGAAWIHRNYIAIKGAMSVQFYDEVEGNQHYYITRNPDEPHHFCNFECLNDFADLRKTEWEKARERRLRNEAQSS